MLKIVTPGFLIVTENKKNLIPLFPVLLSVTIQLGILFYSFNPAMYFYKYWELGLRLRGIIAPPIEVFYSSPFYILLLAFFQVLGLNYIQIQIIQVVLGALNCWLIYRAGTIYFNRPVGFIASLVAVCYGSFLIYNSSFLPTAWVVSFNLAGLICLGNYGRKKKVGWLIGAGIFIGFSIITRPNISVFLLLLLPWVAVSCRTGNRASSKQTCSEESPARLKSKYRSDDLIQAEKKWKCGVGRIFCLVIPAIMVVLPIAGLNFFHSGEFIPVTASGGWVFYCGNNERVKGFDFSPPPEMSNRISSYYVRSGNNSLSYLEHLVSREMAQERTGCDLNHGESSSFWLGEGIKFLSRNPGLYLKLLGKKLLSALNSYEPHDVPEVMVRADQLKAYSLIGAALIFPLALLGIITCRPRTGGIILYLYLLSYLISFLMMYVIPRFRMPVVPLLILFAAAAGFKIYSQIRARQWIGLVRNIIILFPLIVLVNIRTPAIKRDRDIVRPAFIHEWKGLTFMKRGKREDAGDEFRKALELNPRSHQARYNLELLGFEKF